MADDGGMADGGAIERSAAGRGGGGIDDDGCFDDGGNGGGGIDGGIVVSRYNTIPTVPLGSIRSHTRHQKKLCHHLALSSRRESPSSTQSCLPSNMRSFDLASKRSRALRGARICRARWPTHSPPLSSSVLMVGRHPWWSGRPLVVFVHSSGLSQP